MGTFGQTLRQAREDLGASLADAERETHISRRYLQALENEDEEALPAAVYTRGFIKIYCQYLGLNPDGMVDLFGPRQALVDNVAIRPIPAEISQPRSVPVRPAVAVAGLVLVSLLAVYLWGQYTSFQENVGRIETAPTTRTSSTPFAAGATPSPQPTVLAGPSPGPAASSPGPAAPVRGLVVDARVVERTWMEVWVDGRSVMAETVQSGFSRSFTAEQQVRMRVGNAAGVQVVVNGATQGPLGARGQAVDAIWGRQ
ncbi:MAG: helix-turn-helix domain-containing protein [Chloroflexi bacterium]|nr:helix-turn-helix domain-containing protein [Chloroflexota bacterium]